MATIPLIAKQHSGDRGGSGDIKLGTWRYGETQSFRTLLSGLNVMTYPKMRPASGGTNAERPWKEKKEKDDRQGQSDLMLPGTVGDQSPQVPAQKVPGWWCWIE
ncbi:hypothetical protein MKX08_006376 [Trichoderma sp. CBMAI-0020]|nr:hypothetical protein MKX08_006376 [Trichoderma sp. CBMAI-0020]